VRIRHLTIVPLLALGLSLPAVGRDRDPGGRPLRAAEIRKALRAEDGAKRAWAAYDAGREHLVEVAPDLVAMLDREEGPPTKMPSLAIRAAALDALILMEFQVPVDRLLPHVGYSLAPTLTTLVIQGHRSDPAALSLYFDAVDLMDSWNWLAVGNLLHRMRAPRFARRHLAGTCTHVTVRVRDTEGQYRPPSGEVHGHGFMDAPEGYPPLVLYRLGSPPKDPAKRDRRRLLSDGTHPVCTTRMLDRRIWFSSRFGGPDEAPIRAEWIEEMLLDAGGGPPEHGTRRGGWWRMEQPGFSRREGPPVTIEPTLYWAGTQPLLRQIGREHRALGITLRDTAERLVRAGRMTDEEARTIRLRVQYSYRDLRRDRRQPLPEIPAYPETALFQKRPSPAEGFVLK